MFCLRFQKIYVSYDIPHIAKCSSVIKLIENTIYFNESHVFFITEEYLLKLVEFLQTGKLILKVTFNA